MKNADMNENDPDQPLNADDLLRESAHNRGIGLALLVADTAIWPSVEAHRLLIEKTKAVAVYPAIRRCRASAGEVVGKRVGGIFFDDNSYANHAIKAVMDRPRQHIVGFEVCHIWRLTAYDQRYHTALANLVLLPRGLAGLSDHDAQIEAILRYRSYQLYDRWLPAGQADPQEPAGYPRTWRDPGPLGDKGRRFLLRRCSEMTGPLASAKSVPTRNLQKFILDGKSFGKGRLVQAVVRAYLANEPDTTYAESKTLFHDELQRGHGKVYGVIRTEGDARTASGGGLERFFLKPVDIILAGDDVRVAVCNQWGAKNIPAFLDHARGLGFDIQPEK